MHYRIVWGKKKKEKRNMHPLFCTITKAKIISCMQMITLYDLILKWNLKEKIKIHNFQKDLSNSLFSKDGVSRN